MPLSRLTWHKGRCEARIYKRDTYRRTGRGPTGFEMHYTTEQCSRKPVKDGLCKQHYNQEHRFDGKALK